MTGGDCDQKYLFSFRLLIDPSHDGVGSSSRAIRKKKKKRLFNALVFVYRFDENNKYFIQKCVIDRMA